MRAILFGIITLAVIAAGVYFGKREFEARRDAMAPPPVEPVTVRGDAVESPVEGGRRSPEESGSPRVEQPSRPRPPDDAEIARAIRRIEERLARDGFRAVGEVASDELESLLEAHDALRGDPELAEALAPLRRWKLKAEVFAAVVDPIERQTLPERLYEVTLTNGNVLTARRADLVGNEYDISVLPSGEVVRPRDTVSRVDELSREQYLARLETEITANAERITSPIDMYVKVVAHCFRWGMTKTGYEFLERLLTMPKSSQVPAIFAHDPDGDITMRWEQAAGRAPLDPLPGTAVASAPPPSPDTSGARPPTERPEPALLDPSVVIETDPARIADALREVRRLRIEAQTIYQKVVVGHQGKLDDLHEARQKLEDAVDILARLPRNQSDVKNARREVAQLLHAVIKSLPF